MIIYYAELINRTQILYLNEYLQTQNKTSYTKKTYNSLSKVKAISNQDVTWVWPLVMRLAY